MAQNSYFVLSLSCHSSIIITPTQNLLTSRPQNQRMLILRSITPLNITKRRIRIHNPHITQILQSTHILLLLPLPIPTMHSERPSILAFQPSSTECQRAKSFVNMRQEIFGTGHSQWDTGSIKVLHVVGAFEIFDNVAASGGAECFNGEYFIFFHFGNVVGFDNGDGFSGVDLVGSDGMAVEVAYALDRVSLPIQLHLITLHNLLHGLPHITQPHINTRSRNPRIRRRLHRLQQRIILGIKRHRPRTINNPSINLRTKIYLHDIIVG
mmetsp:Transcript_32466/g.68282  ORF Transcript_32466/g.68282 Transcript_32466/m.68282 type:complete len:267 (-) Transcript_32466:536-1336(-)